MNEKRNVGLAYLIALPAILLLIIFKFRPLIGEFIIPFKKYHLGMTLSNSPWVGLSNFQRVFDSFYFSKIIYNTLTINFLYIIISAVIALLLALSISSIGSKKIQYIFCIIALIPLFIPASTYGIIYRDFILNKDMSNIQTMPIRFICATFQAVRIVGIPVGIAVVLNHKHTYNKMSNIVKTIFAFMLIQITSILTTNFDIMSFISSPMTYEKTDTLSNYIFRSGFMGNDISVSSTVWIIKYLIEFILAVIVLIIISKYFKKDLFIEQDSMIRDNINNDTVNEKQTILGYIIPVIHSLVIIGFIVYIIIKALSLPAMWQPGMTLVFIKFFIMYSFVSVLCVIVSVLLAYPLTIHGVSKKIYSIFLLAILIDGDMGIYKYIYFKNFNMVNTYLPIIILGMFSIISVFTFAGIFNSRYSQNINGLNGEGSIFGFYMRKMLKPSIGIAALQFSLLWGSMYNSLVYINNQRMFSPNMYFRNMFLGAQMGNIVPNYYLIALIMIIIPVAILIGLGKFIISDALVSKIR